MKNNESHREQDAGGELRIDKWLWTARFFKTRPLATDAVNGGHVHLNGQRVKAGRTLRVGDSLSINRDGELYEITVTGINKTRRPAKEAKLLYEELEESRLKREQQHQLKKLAAQTRPVPKRRPDKRDREALKRFKTKF